MAKTDNDNFNSFSSMNHINTYIERFQILLRIVFFFFSLFGVYGIWEEFTITHELTKAKQPKLHNNDNAYFHGALFGSFYLFIIF